LGTEKQHSRSNNKYQDGMNQKKNKQKCIYNILEHKSTGEKKNRPNVSNLVSQLEQKSANKEIYQ
jgi:hypothetical protein